MSASALLDTQAAAPAGSSHSPLWSPLTTPPNTTRTFAFLRSINHKYSLRLSTYEDLWKWSVEHPSEFWDAVWDDTDVLGVKGQRGAGVPSTATPAQNPAWFPDAKLNWAENMLRRRDDKVALIQATEPTPTSPTPTYRRCTYAQLYELTSQVFHALRKAGVGAGDRVASYASNCIENVAAALATSAIGGIWVSVSADFGPDAALSRFQQVQPKVIFTVDETVYNAKVHNHLPKVGTLLSALKSAGQEPKVVVISSSSSSLAGDASTPTNSGWNKEWTTWKAFLESGNGSGEIEWFRGGFDWPLWILFSSGTTNKPKPIVHRAGGMLLQSKKEFVIQADLKEDDVFFYYTTTGWMMWNFLVNALSTGCTLVLYDGSPLKDPSLLWRMTDELGITIFGTSAKYIDQLSRDYKPKDHHGLSTLRQIHSTGSPLAAHLFDWVYENIKKDVLLASITGPYLLVHPHAEKMADEVSWNAVVYVGGTDICSLFAGMSTALPVYRSELQCRMLGMAVESYTSDGKPTRPGQSGELVCTKPFPCQPLGFWPLPGYGTDDEVKAAQERYRQSYFDEFPDIWYHGDHVLITESREGNGGGVIMLGRSDGVLNPGGIRFGSSEIYNVLDAAFSPSSAHHIVDSLVVGQAIQGGVDERVVLFVKLADGRVLDDALRKAVKTEVRARRTARHVPEKILQVSDIPYTLNAKKVEVPIKKILNGVSVDAVNVTTLRNPECLAEYVKIGEVLRKEVS